MKSRLFAIVFGALVACANTGSVHEKTPLTQDLSAYRTAAVEVELPADAKNAATQKTAFANVIGDKLKAQKVFAEITPGSADLTIKVVVTQMGEGSKLAQSMGGGDAELAASVDLLDTKQSKSIGAFDVKGNSKSNVHTSVGGVDTKAMEDNTGRAFGAAADEIAAYLAKHRGAAK